MRRNRKLHKREQLDRLYNSPLVGKLINYVMYDGRRLTAERVVYAALKEAAKRTEKEPLAFSDTPRNILQSQFAKRRP